MSQSLDPTAVQAITFNISDITYHTCTTADDFEPWCGTDVDEENLYQSRQYGYCPEKCNGEIPEFDSDYNLASHTELWSVELFDLNPYKGGLCHTYNPPRETPPGVAGHFYAWLGNKGKLFIESNLLGFEIFLHDKDQFWPGPDMKRIGISEMLFLKKNTEWTGHYEFSQQSHINKENSPCEEDPRYSFQKCILNWVSETAGCHLSWFSSPPSDNIKSCDSTEDILRLIVKVKIEAEFLKLSHILGIMML